MAEPDQNSPAAGEEGRGSRKWILVILLTVLVVCPLGAAAALFLTLPDVEKLSEAPPAVTAMMKYREEQAEKKGRTLRRRYDWVPGRRISPYLRNAVLIAEDDKFFQHQGFDWEEMRQAMEKNRDKKRIVRGGSTITQQLAKNLYLKPARTPWRKLREALIARRLEKKLTKPRILELYLNVIEWGEGLYGCEAAARHYFGKSAAQLTPAEAIRLASVIINPHRYSPLSDKSRRMRDRRLMLAEVMYKRHLFDEAVYEALRAEFSPP